MENEPEYLYKVTVSEAGASYDKVDQPLLEGIVTKSRLVNHLAPPAVDRSLVVHIDSDHDFGYFFPEVVSRLVDVGERVKIFPIDPPDHNLGEFRKAGGFLVLNGDGAEKFRYDGTGLTPPNNYQIMKEPEAKKEAEVKTDS